MIKWYHNLMADYYYNKLKKYIDKFNYLPENILENRKTYVHLKSKLKYHDSF
jgi:hypothetical protein